MQMGIHKGKVVDGGKRYGIRNVLIGGVLTS